MPDIYPTGYTDSCLLRILKKNRLFVKQTCETFDKYVNDTLYTNNNMYRDLKCQFFDVEIFDVLSKHKDSIKKKNKHTDIDQDHSRLTLLLRYACIYNSTDLFLLLHKYIDINFSREIFEELILYTLSGDNFILFKYILDSTQINEKISDWLFRIMCQKNEIYIITFFESHQKKNPHFYRDDAYVTDLIMFLLGVDYFVFPKEQYFFLNAKSLIFMIEIVAKGMPDIWNKIIDNIIRHVCSRGPIEILEYILQQPFSRDKIANMPFKNTHIDPIIMEHLVNKIPNLFWLIYPDVCIENDSLKKFCAYYSKKYDIKLDMID